MLAGSRVQYVDVYTSFANLIANAAAMNFTETKAACHKVLNIGQGAMYGPTCANPDNYIFWDQFHPTGRVHRILGNGVLAAAARPFFGSNYTAPPSPPLVPLMPPAAAPPPVMGMQPPAAAMPPPAGTVLGRKLLQEV